MEVFEALAANVFVALLTKIMYSSVFSFSSLLVDLISTVAALSSCIFLCYIVLPNKPNIIIDSTLLYRYLNHSLTCHFLISNFVKIWLNKLMN